MQIEEKYNKGKKKSLQKYPEKTKMIGLAKKDIKTDIINIFTCSGKQRKVDIMRRKMENIKDPN